MYIPQFWAGVLCTIIVEVTFFTLLIIFAIIKSTFNSNEDTPKNDRRDKNE